MKRRRRAETLAEFLVAMIVFAFIMTGVFDFTANQLTNAARVKDYDFFMFYTQKYINEHSNSIPNSGEITDTERGDITFKRSNNVLTAAQGNKSMKFTISN
ncbi:MAG: prepilin-type N-terminal cleavage/methylation domain-containing protein [Synergistaceae bacterium]|nr:prepilin-type N-terminal cleavage/methylation domain-containing protein [Synergistaceae bacterium]